VDIGKYRGGVRRFLTRASLVGGGRGDYWGRDSVVALRLANESQIEWCNQHTAPCRGRTASLRDSSTDSPLTAELAPTPPTRVDYSGCVFLSTLKKSRPICKTGVLKSYGLATILTSNET